MQFRKDINGLRAIAVIAVVLFHFNASWLPGGFAGVDVFFVISGFLMTRIIFRGIEQENFSLLNFYVARANRIIPALAVLCLVLLVFGWFFLTPLDYKTLGKHAASSMGFLSNVFYWREVGYFDAMSQEKWLLHTWSLSVEWQFYIIFPLVLVAMKKFMSISMMKKTVLLGTVIGFIFCVIATYKWPGASYYLLPTRAWEMMLGGVAYLYPFSIKEKRKKLVEWLGLTLVFGSYFLISKENLWPGYLAIFPVLGSFLIIQAQRHDSIITNNVISQKIGSWSYSIYLWHWPLVVIIYTFSLNAIFIYLGIVLSILFGFLSSKYIEKIKFENDFGSLFSYLKCKPAYIVIFVGLLSSSIFIRGGVNMNFALTEYYDDIKYPRYCHVDGGNYDSELSNLDCKLGSKKVNPIGLVWGDSYAGMLDPFVINILNEDQSFISRTTSHCFPSLSLTEMLGGLPEYCKLIRERNIEEIAEQRYDVIFLAGRWESMYLKYGDAGLVSVIEAVSFSAKHAKLVYFVEQPVFYKKRVGTSFLRSKVSPLYPNVFEKDDELARSVNKKLRDAIVSKNYNNVYYIDRDIIYGSNRHSDFTSGGFPYTYDLGHLTEAGSVEASNHFITSDIYIPLKNILEKIDLVGI
jgi:peptidoglycan/LPS O-acetylase OafA/YrhL